ncbi:hypothetical protein ACHAXT_003639 [Thalassiosira profunda]
MPTRVRQLKSSAEGPWEEESREVSVQFFANDADVVELLSSLRERSTPEMEEEDGEPGGTAPTKPTRARKLTPKAAAAQAASSREAVAEKAPPPRGNEGGAVAKKPVVKKPAAKKANPLSCGRKPCPEIGPGWTVESRRRRTGSTIDKYYYSPEGTQFKSGAAARRFLEGTGRPGDIIVPRDPSKAPAGRGRNGKHAKPTAKQPPKKQFRSLAEARRFFAERGRKEKALLAAAETEGASKLPTGETGSETTARVTPDSTDKKRKRADETTAEGAKEECMRAEQSASAQGPERPATDVGKPAADPHNHRASGHETKKPRISIKLKVPKPKGEASQKETPELVDSARIDAAIADVKGMHHVAQPPSGEWLA